MGGVGRRELFGWSWFGLEVTTLTWRLRGIIFRFYRSDGYLDRGLSEWKKETPAVREFPYVEDKDKANNKVYLEVLYVA